MDFQIPDTVQDELEDLTHRRVVDGTLVLFGDLSEDLLLPPGVEEGLARLGLYRHQLLHYARPLVEDAYELPVNLVYPAPEILYPVLRARIIHRRGNDINYSQYVSNNGIIGFRTQSGCKNHCPYCIEADKKILLGNIPNIIEELKYIVDQGYNHFHLCDSEFNNDLHHCINFCKALKRNNISLKWTLYMKPTPFNDKLIKLLSETNAYLITLTVDSDRKIQELNNYSYSDLSRFIKLCDKFNIELAIDLLTGYPNEPFDSTKRVINFFKNHRPTRVSINYYYRLAKYTPLTRLIMKETSLQENLTRKLVENEDFLKPVFYSHYTQEIIEELIEDDDIFSIAGISSGVNYQFSEEANN